METREETGYTDTKPCESKRVSIADYGKAAKAEKAKEELNEILKQLKRESQQLKRGV